MERTFYQRLSALKAELCKKGLKKTGKNAHLKFAYFQLDDFLPTVLHLCNKYDLTETFTYEFVNGELYPTLTFRDAKNPEHFEKVMTPPVMANINNNAIQSLGSSITYLRRYCYMMLLGICEADVIDAMNPEDLKPIKEATPAKNEPKGACRGKEIQTVLNGKDLDTRAFAQWVESTFKVINLDHLTDEQAGKVLEVLAKKPDKR